MLAKSCYTLISTQFSVQSIYIKDKYIFLVNGKDKIYRSKPLDFFFPLILDLSNYCTFTLKHNENLLTI